MPHPYPRQILWIFCILALISGGLLAACGNDAPQVVTVVVTATPAPTATPLPTTAPAATPPATATSTPAPTATLTPTAAATHAPTPPQATQTPEPTHAPTSEPTATTPPTPTSTAEPTATPEPAAAPSPTPTATLPPSPTPAATPEPTPPQVTPTPEPTAKPTATPRPTATPQATPRSTLTGYIPALDGHVAEMKFYESPSYGYKAVPLDDRVYRKTFPRSTTRYVIGELFITFPIPDRRIDFEIDVVFYQSDGSVVARRTSGGYVNEHWGRGSDYWVFSAGSGQPSQWKAGLYRADLSVDGELIASEEFEIVDRQIPASGPFLELRDGLPWAAQPLGLDEENALLALSSMMETDPALAVQVADLPWMRQALTHEGRNALQALDILATANVDLAKRVAGSSLLADGVTEGGWLSLRTMASLAATDEDLVDLVAGLPWLANDEGLTVSYVLKILGESPAVAETLLVLPWLADGITDMEAVALKYLSQISGRNADAAAALIAMPFLKTLEGRDTLALRSLSDVARQNPIGFKEVLSYPKISDGITDEDTKIVAVLGGCTSGWVPESTQVLLAETGVYIEERVIELPYTGETLLAVIRTQDRVSQSMDYLEHTSRTIERFMGEPYPTNYLAVLYYDHPAIDNACGRDTHLIFHADADSVDGPKWHAGVLAHETAHRYWIHDWEDWPYQWWITEGVAEFFKAFSEHKRIGRPLEPTSKPCGFFDNISEMEEARPDTTFIPGKLTPRECFYSLGERFFLDLYHALGDETFRAGLHTFYKRYWPLYSMTYLQDNPADGCGRPPLNICRLEAAFKDGASDEVVRKVDEVIARWYGPRP